MRGWMIATTLMLEAPAAAQVAGPPERPPARVPTLIKDAPSTNPGTLYDVADARDRIHDARRNGELTKREARHGRREANQIGTLADRYAVGGTSASEQRELDARAYVLRDQINAQRTRRGNN